MTPQIVAVDHFAGTGWGVACHWLGIREYGVEIMPAAIRTRSANGFRTIYRDVWAGLFHPELVPAHDLYIASPPCQTFSMAGGGEGRDALDDVLRAIDDRRYESAEALHELGTITDAKTALVLTPLAHIWAHRPRLIALEQVPPVLPVWHAIARVLRTIGYSVWAGILSAEQYGVPQTRQRAILMARLDGVVKPPAPTHSRYYSSDPKRLDPDVEPWISMAEAIGWGMTERPFITAGNAVGRAEGVGGSGAKAAIEREKKRGAWRVGFPRRADGGAATADGYRERDFRDSDAPAPTLTEKTRSWIRVETGQNSDVGGGRTEKYSKSVEVPAPTVTGQTRSWVYRNGNQRNAAQRPTNTPAPTVHFGAAANDVRWAPATTVQGDPRIAQRGHHERQMDNAERVTVAEAAALQSYPEGFVWVGSKTKTFLQIGNAVPPLLAEAILRALLEPPIERDEWASVFAEVAG